MKYTILGFQQQKLIDSGLSVEDAFILRTIKDMYSSSSMIFKDFEGIKYMWINYTYLLEQIPIIGSKRNLMRKIEFYGTEQFLLRVLKKEKDGVKGNFSYIAPTSKLDTLQDFDLMTESHKGYDKNAQGLCQNSIRVMTESHNKDTSIKDTSIKDNINRKVAKSKDLEPIINSFTSNLELIQAINDFVEMREEIKKTITSRGLTLMLNKLKKISANENEQILILNQSIESSWTGIFPLNKNNTPTKTQQAPPTKRYKDFGNSYD